MLMSLGLLFIRVILKNTFDDAQKIPENSKVLYKC